MRIDEISKIEEAARRIENDAPFAPLHAADDARNERDEDELPFGRAHGQKRPRRGRLEVRGLAERLPGGVLAPPAADLVRIVKALGRGKCLGVGHGELAPGELARAVDAGNALESEKHASSVRPGGADDEPALVASALPLDARPRLEALGKIRREIHGDLSVESVRPADEADEKNRRVSV
jgi:hypothetical protein